MTVATNGYLSHWAILLRSIEQNFYLDCQVFMHVFTNDLEGAAAIKPRDDRVQVIAHEVPNWGWPEATLLRFRAIHEKADAIKSDISCWLDADMIVERPTGPELQPSTWTSGLAFVRHPGFWRPPLAANALIWARTPRVIPNDLIWFAKGRPALGAWEDNPQSLAFVEQAARSTYVCGGAWFGRTDAVKQMVGVLARRTDEDLSNGLIARWHDESHLNWYFAHNGGTLLGPSYCYEETYPRLLGVKPHIKAVNKGAKFQKERAAQR